MVRETLNLTSMNFEDAKDKNRMTITEKVRILTSFFRFE
jgi:hypothetical protein